MTPAMAIQLKNLTVDFDNRFQCRKINWTLNRGEHWLITGSNGSGKSALAAILAGYGDIEYGVATNLPQRVGLVSFEAQAELIAAERRKDDADIMDVISEGTPVREIIDAVAKDTDTASQLIEQLGLTPLLDRAFRKLSTGETRKVMLIRALSCEPQLLILDEPFEGLDAQSLEALQQHLATVAQHTPVVMILNRLDQCPDYISHIAYMNQGELQQTIARNDKQAHDALMQLLHLKTSDMAIPLADPDFALPALQTDQPLVKVTNAAIRYGDLSLIHI